MKKLLLLTGDIAAGKSTFSRILSKRYHTAALQKDDIKEVLGDIIGFQNREENQKLSKAAVKMMCHLFSRLAQAGDSLILEANFHAAELEELRGIAEEHQYEVLTLVLRGDTDVLHQRYMRRIQQENRHPVHLSARLDDPNEFARCAEFLRNEKITGSRIEINASDFSYQTDEALLRQIDQFMGGSVPSTIL